MALKSDDNDHQETLNGPSIPEHSDDVEVFSMASPQFEPRRIQAQGQYTDTWYEQNQVEERILLIRQSLSSRWNPVLMRDRHISWLARSLRSIPSGYDAFDCLQSWLAFWIVHSLNLLGAPIPPSDATTLVRHLSSFRDSRHGGYGGGPRQSAHLASTFSVIMALCSIGTPQALESIDVQSVSTFLHAVKQPDGSFRVSEGGEADVRAVYCALAVASILHLIPRISPDGSNWGDDTLLRGVPNFIASLQSFDGGLAGEPGAEAHGGHTYCALASLAFCNALTAVDRAAVLDWAVMRQMAFEGGFQGRTNKLVDSCYSFWVGALFPILSEAYRAPPDDDQGADCNEFSKSYKRGVAELFDANALQNYVLECCQLSNGGLRDKPGTPRDLMHTCYGLSGLSVAQTFGGDDMQCRSINRVCRIDVLHNLREDRLANAAQYFNRQKGEY